MSLQIRVIVLKHARDDVDFLSRPSSNDWMAVKQSLLQYYRIFLFAIYTKWYSNKFYYVKFSKKILIIKYT